VIEGYTYREPRVRGGYGGRDVRLPKRKATRLMEKAKALLRLAAQNSLIVERNLVESFVGAISSLALAVPETGFYLRILQASLSRGSGMNPLEVFRAFVGVHRGTWSAAGRTSR
jgi:hypothetical protein